MTAAPGVRPGGRRDVEALVSLWEALVDHHAPLDPHYRGVPDAAAAWGDRLSRLLCDPEAAVFVQERDGRIAGFVVVETTGAPPALREPPRAEITDLFVRPEVRCGGIGRALVEAALAWLAERGAGRVEVRVLHANPEGQAFWRALGFGEFVDVLHRRL